MRSFVGKVRKNGKAKGLRIPPMIDRERAAVDDLFLCFSPFLSSLSVSHAPPSLAHPPTPTSPQNHNPNNLFSRSSPPR